jgi:hypothetical protein
MVAVGGVFSSSSAVAALGGGGGDITVVRVREHGEEETVGRVGNGLYILASVNILWRTRVGMRQRIKEFCGASSLTCATEFLNSVAHDNSGAPHNVYT